MNQNVLFLMDKSVDSNPAFGTSPSFHNFLYTFQRHQPDFRVHTLHYDEIVLLSGVHVDNVLVPYCSRFNIGTVFVFFQGESPLNPSAPALGALKNMGIKICAVYPDSNPQDLARQESLRGLIDLNVLIDNRAPRVEIPDSLWLWVPQDESLFYPDIKKIPVSFVGSTRYPDRADYVSRIKDIQGIVIAGGQRETRLTHQAYANLVRKSEIGINFSGNPMGSGYQQIKGRCFEILASQSLLLEEKNEATRQLFEPGIDYVEFENIIDLAEAIEYYRNKPEERNKIADRGYRKFKENFTANIFWQRVIGQIYGTK